MSILKTLNLFCANYLRMTKNLLLFHLTSSLLFFVIVTVLLIPLSKEILLSSKNHEHQEYVILFIILLVPACFLGSLVKKINTDERFLKENITRPTFYLLRGAQIYFVGLIITLLMSVPFLLNHTIGFTHLLMSFVLLVPVATFSLVFLIQIKRNNSKKPLIRGEKFIRVVAPQKYGKIFSIAYLNFSYFFRKTKYIYFLVFAVVFSNLCISAYLLNNQKNDLWLFIIPFAFPVFQAFDSNSEIFSDLTHYTSFSKVCSFCADYIFWVLILFFQWLITVLMLETIGFQALQTFALFVPIVLGAMTYCLLVKFYMINQKLKRAVTIAISIGLPMIIPFVLILIMKDFINDRS